MARSCNQPGSNDRLGEAGGDALPVSLTWTPRSSFRGDVRLTAGILVFLSGTKVAAMALNAIGRCWRAGGIQGDRNGQVDM